MKLGDVGNDIKQLQENLKKLGFFTGTIDSVFTSELQNSVCRVQQKVSLPTNGIVDHKTLTAIDTLLSKLPKPKPKPVVIHKKLIEMNEKVFANVHPEVVKLGKQLRQIVKDKYNIDIIFTYGFRSFAQQNSLYAIGRTKPGKKVTNAKAGESFHNYGLALDFVPIVNGKADWNDMEKFKKVAQEAVKLGFESGANFTSIKDYPHIQKTFGLSIKELLSGERPK